MNYAKRLDLQLDLKDILAAPRKLIQTTDRKVISKYRHANWGILEHEPTPLLMWELPQEIKQRVLEQLPEKLLEREVPGVFLMTMEKPQPTPSQLPPHIDRGRRCAINIYLECNDEETHFFSADEEAKKLAFLEKFVAKPGEAWAIDVSKPHAVIMSESPRRSGLTLSFRHVRFPELMSLLEGK